MKVISTDIPEVKRLVPRVFEDHRGYFFESFRSDVLAENGIHDVFVQDNQSRSAKGILRGLHLQDPPYAQSKLVRAIMGEILDVAVDVRKNSPTFGKWVAVKLTEQNKESLYVPEGFAHGFYVLSEIAVVSYKCNRYYHHPSERCLAWNDPEVGVEWQLDGEPTLSDKDKIGLPLEAFR